MIYCKIGKRWMEHPDQLAARIAAIIRGKENGFQPRPSPGDEYEFHYQLDSHNDWFLLRTADDTVRVTYRYNHESNIRLEVWDGLKTVIEWACK